MILAWKQVIRVMQEQLPKNLKPRRYLIAQEKPDPRGSFPQGGVLPRHYCYGVNHHSTTVRTAIFQPNFYRILAAPLQH